MTPPNDEAPQGRRAVLPHEGLRVLAGRRSTLRTRLLAADVDGRRDEDEQGAARRPRRPASSIDVPWRVGRLPLGVEEVAGSGHHAAEDRLDLHGAGAVLDLDLGAGAGSARERRRRVGAGARVGRLPGSRAADRPVLVAGRRGVPLLRRRHVGRRRRVGGRRRGITALRRAAPGLRTRRRLRGVATKLTTTRQSPNMISSPGCSRALVIRSPLTIVPRVEPRSMRWMSSGPLTSMTACMRDTVSSSRRRWEDASFPTLITSWARTSSRTSSSPLKI